MPTTTVPPRALVLLAILTLVWGTNWPLFAVAVREVSVLTFRGISVPICGLILLAVARARGQSLSIPRQYWKTIVIATMFYLVLWNITSTYSAVMIPSGQSAVLGYTMPLWSGLISWAILGEKLSKRLISALVLGTASVCLLMIPSFGAYAQAPLGLALGLIAGLGWAIGTLILKRANVQVPATVLTGWQMLITSVPILGGAMVFGDHQWFMPSWQTIVVITWITLVPMCIGNVCWFAIVSLLPANIAGVSSIMVPMVAMVSGAIVHGEPLGPMQLAAMACCAGALSLTLLKPKTTS